jgi:DNA-binding MarR family transcriptional regulator
MRAGAKRKSEFAQAASAEDRTRKSVRAPRALPLTISRPELLWRGSDRDFRHLVHGLFGFLARHQRIRDGHAKVIGLLGIEYTVLIAVAHLSLDGDVNVKTVADHLHLSGAFITSVAQRLLTLGMIRKQTDTGDRRRVTLTVSAQGHAALERLAPIQRQVNDVEFAALGREEFRLLIEIMDRLIESANRAVTLQTYLLASRDATSNRWSKPGVSHALRRSAPLSPDA